MASMRLLEETAKALGQHTSWQGSGTSEDWMQHSILKGTQLRSRPRGGPDEPSRCEARDGKLLERCNLVWFEKEPLVARTSGEALTATRA